jgi:DNA polymerase III epsilon subunit family exonuclease
MVILDSKGKRIYRSVVFDVETTGGSTRLGDRVIEIGAVAIEGKSIVDEFHSLISTTQPINPFAYRVHGITKEMLDGQPTADKIIPKFNKFIKNSILVAHNASFDVRFIQNEFTKHNLKFNNVCFCTLKLGRSLYPDLESHNLLTLYHQFYTKPPGRMHRALEDARVTAKIWMKVAHKVIV